MFALDAKSNYTVSTCLKQNKVTLEASLGHYSRSVKGCVGLCVCECVSILGYMADIRLYPSFHQLSEKESSSNTLQSDPDVCAHTHTHTDFNTQSSRKADMLQLLAIAHQYKTSLLLSIDHHCHNTCLSGPDPSFQYYIISSISLENLKTAVWIYLK